MTLSLRVMPAAAALLLLGLTSLSSQAQGIDKAAPPYQVWPLKADAQSEDYSDLAPLGQALAKAQVVGLAEQTHGAHEEFAYKLRLLRYLHEKLGFEVLQLESGFYDLGRISQAMARGAKLDDLAPGNVFFMYSKSAEGRRLLQYVDQTQASAKPLKLAGTDSQHSGELSGKTLLNELQAALQSKGHAALAEGKDWQLLKDLASPLLALQRTPPDAAAQAAFFAHSQRLRDALCPTPDPQPNVNSPAWWCRVVHSLEAQARSIWSGDADYQRDNAMGANSIWLTDQMYGGRKTVIWAHIVHLARGFQRSPTHLQAGEVMHRHWGSRYQIVHFSAGGGEILDFGNLKPLALPTLKAGSLEAQLLARKTQHPLLVHASQPVTLPQYAFEYLYQGKETSALDGQLGRHWDWLIFFPKVSPVRMVR